MGCVHYLTIQYLHKFYGTDLYVNVYFKVNQHIM